MKKKKDLFLWWVFFDWLFSNYIFYDWHYLVIYFTSKKAFAILAILSSSKFFNFLSNFYVFLFSRMSNVPHGPSVKFLVENSKKNIKSFLQQTVSETKFARAEQNHFSREAPHVVIPEGPCPYPAKMPLPVPLNQTTSHDCFHLLLGMAESLQVFSPHSWWQFFPICPFLPVVGGGGTGYMTHGWMGMCHWDFTDRPT